MFKCRTNSTGDMAWHFIAPAASSLQLISAGQYIHEDFNSRFTLDKNTEHFNLKIKQAQRTDGGTYVCEDADASASASLIVIGKSVFLRALICCIPFIWNEGLITTVREFCFKH